MSRKNLAAVLYDGDCALCNKGRDLLQRLDWNDNLYYVNMRDEAALAGVGVTCPDEDWLGQMHVVVPQSAQILSGFTAIRWLLWRLPLLCWLAPLLYLPGVPTLGQRLYLWVAKNRFQLVPCHNHACSLSARPTAAK